MDRNHTTNSHAPLCRYDLLRIGNNSLFMSLVENTNDSYQEDDIIEAKRLLTENVKDKLKDEKETESDNYQNLFTYLRYFLFFLLVSTFVHI